jgi:hypothetical protein
VSSPGSAPSLDVADNWAGYAQESTSNGIYWGVRGYWNVPKVTAGGGDPSYASDWVGIDGFRDDTYGKTDLIQAGTASYWVDGKAEYFAWTETIPGPYKVITSLPVTAGERIKVTVEATASTTWVMQIRNLTTGGRYNAPPVTYPAEGQSAECIHERPKVKGHMYLATTSDVTFSPCQYSPYADEGGRAVWKPLLTPLTGEAPATVYQIVMKTHKRFLVSTSLPNAAQDGFTVADGATAPPPPK